MFCYQCEQTAKGQGCTTAGVCGKDAQTAALQDALLHITKGVAMYARRSADLGSRDREIDAGIVEALFTTVTNVNFDSAAIESTINKTLRLRDSARSTYEDASARAAKPVEKLYGPAVWQPEPGLSGLVKQSEELSIAGRKSAFGDDITGLQELITYGLKGMAAYVDHAMILGKESNEVFTFFAEALDALTDPAPTIEGLFKLALRTGEMNIKAMELLDAANTGAYGHPEPTRVRTAAVKGKAILVSGHDLKDLEELLKQTDGRGINVYTHGEMLPANAYPGLKKYKHLAGNFGGAWQDQAKEFDQFPGAILMTTNCIQRPKDTYKARIFTSGLVGWPGVAHIKDRNFMPLIEAAIASPGFSKDEPDRQITIGFARNAVMSVAGKIVDAVKTGRIKHFFLVGGCDGAKSGRNYYTDFAQQAPKDTVILTLACGKFRFNKLEFGEIDGIPRLLDIGQCNDAYSAIQIAVALSRAFNTDVNSLPLSMVLSWYEQKAVVILLSLLHLGIKNIRLGPSLPAFVTPAVLKVLQDKFNIMPVTGAEQDLKAILKTG
ncbi:MAG: hydroxylamine reductase [Bdellovibrionales bacterium RIFOXYD1_FULL_53_11]|nr:MAG: hydroxylamine reductase [Bdellovibrionales bacterium RIFOXYD1_FULL_53_11]